MVTGPSETVLDGTGVEAGIDTKLDVTKVEEAGTEVETDEGTHSELVILGEGVAYDAGDEFQREDDWYQELDASGLESIMVVVSEGAGLDDTMVDSLVDDRVSTMTLLDGVSAYNVLT